MSSFEYSGIAPYYDRWCSGDSAYHPSRGFYIDLLRRYEGVFIELGVGTGRIAIPLSQDDNRHVIGVDRCRAMLNILRKTLPSDANLDLVEEDFISFKSAKLADVVYLPFRTIGHVLTDDALLELFRAVHYNLKKGGLFVFDHYMFNRDWALAHNGQDILMFDNGSIRIEDRLTYDFAKGIIHCQIKCNGRVIEEFDFRWLNPEVFWKLIEETNFKCVVLYGDFDYSAWNEDSPNQIWVLQKE